MQQLLPPWVIKSPDGRMVAHNLTRTLDNIMTIHKDSHKPELTYSKSRSLVALVTGTDSSPPPPVVMMMMTSTFQLEHFFTLPLLSCVVAAFMKQRRMGLNDFIQRLAANSYACKQ